MNSENPYMSGPVSDANKDPEAYFAGLNISADHPVTRSIQDVFKKRVANAAEGQANPNAAAELTKVLVPGVILLEQRIARIEESLKILDKHVSEGDDLAAVVRQIFPES